MGLSPGQHVVDIGHRADLLRPRECHPGTRSVLSPLWHSTQSFFNTLDANCILSLSPSQQSACPSDDRYLSNGPILKTVFVWSYRNDQMRAFCNLGSDLSRWSVRRVTWCVSPTMMILVMVMVMMKMIKMIRQKVDVMCQSYNPGAATCQPPILGKWRRYLWEKYEMCNLHKYTKRQIQIKTQLHKKTNTNTNTHLPPIQSWWRRYRGGSKISDLRKDLWENWSRL